MLLGNLFFLVSLLVAARLLRSRAGGHDLLVSWLRLTALVGLGVAGTLLLIPGSLSPLAVILGGATLMVVVELWARFARTRRATALDLLALAIDEGLPLDQALDPLAQEFGGTYGRKLTSFGEQLRAGASLPGLLRARPRLFPPLTLPAIELGILAGRPASLLRELRREVSPALGFARQRGSFPGGYLTTLAIFFFGVGSFSLLKTLPVYLKIFGEFAVPLPWPTRVLISADSQGWWWSLWFLIALVGLVSWVVWLLVVSGWGARWFSLPSHEMPATMRFLALAIEAERPLDAAVEALAQSHPSRPQRRRLMGLRGEIAAGKPWTEGLVDQGLLTARQAGVLTAAQAVGNLPWALRTLADTLERHRTYRRAWFEQTVVPLVVVAIGVLVGLYVVACFWPLVKLIESLA